MALPIIPSGALTPWEKAIQAYVLAFTGVTGSTNTAFQSALNAAVASLSQSIATKQSVLLADIATIESTASSFGVGFGSGAAANTVLQGLTASTASFSAGPTVSTLTSLGLLTAPIIAPSGITPATGQILTALTASTMSWSAIPSIGSGTAGQIATWSTSSTLSGVSVLDTASGGTGLSTYTAEGVLFAPTISTISQVALNTTGTNEFLRQVSSGVPSFAQVATTDLSGTITNTQAAPITSLPNLSAIGTITSGTWNAGVIGPTFGGTGLSTYTQGDTVYASAANTLAKLAGNAITTRNFLTQQGNGTTPSAPSWATLVAGDIPGTLSATTFTGNVTFALTNGLAWTSGGTFTQSTNGDYRFTNAAGTNAVFLRIGTGSADQGGSGGIFFGDGSGGANGLYIFKNGAAAVLAVTGANRSQVGTITVQNMWTKVINGDPASTLNVASISFPTATTGTVQHIQAGGTLTGAGFSFNGEVAAPSWAVSKSTDYTVLTTDTGAVFNNNAAGGIVVTFSLPSAAKGLTYTFCDVLTTALSGIVITPQSGDTIAYSTKTAGQSVSSPIASRGSMKISWCAANTWAVEFFTGTWT